MNNYKINIERLLLTVVLAIITVSCENFIEEENFTDPFAESFITEDNADRLITGTYGSLRGVYKRYNENFFGTDIFTATGNIATDLSALNVYVNINGGSVTGTWTTNYELISNANIAINRYTNEIAWSDSNLSLRDYGIAQAKALRALGYFNLVQQYGGVVLTLEEIDNVSTDYVRSTEEETYAQIIQDLEEAIPDLEEDPEFGRISTRAAQHLLAEVYLTRAYTSFGSSTDFSTAATLAEAAIGGYDIRDQSFAEVFDFDNQINDEILFSVQYGDGGDFDDRNNNKHAILMYRLDQYVGINRANVYGFPTGSFMPTTFFYDLFDANDTRDDVTFHRAIFANEEGTVGTDNIVAGDTVVYFPKVALDLAELTDKLDRYYVYQPGDYYFNDFPVDIPGVNYLYTENVNQTNFPIFKKFDDVGFDEAEGGFRDTFVFRVAGSHLLAAEAHLGAGNTAQALSHINRVRERATGVADFYTTVDIDDILNERALELAGESSRWAVLKRTGKLEERINLYNPHVMTNGAFDASVHLLRPIPDTEIVLSGGNIVQNPGY